MPVKQFLFRSQLREVIRSVGASTDAFSEFVADGGTGEAQIRVIHSAAEASGIAGVPHYVIPPCLTPDSRARGFFGREHLALIRRWLHVRFLIICSYVFFSNPFKLFFPLVQELGLQRHENVTPHVSHAWTLPKTT